ncbi:TPA: hypothetical protein L3884_001531 [Pseudomonas aeruginosa]|uniref:hypothetical protein n=1 Tax=Pseudomonas TaxID=286 RepID=UPI000FFBDEE0|nr:MULTISPECIES: hypothetical protein [Pseudomonas]MBA5010958.1 hypothetical protein [Pseudomonas aeruginosa]HBN9599213.1 hypothetical protein [Pseudomonas aeruginosa]HBN9751314.1 hypothetical protein [Pseudomonas aeruginosa]
MLIKKLVRAVVATDMPVFYVRTDQEGVVQYEPTKLFENLKCLPQLEPFYLAGVKSPVSARELRAFWTACLDIGLEFSPFGPISMNESQSGYLSVAETLNALVGRIRVLYNRPIYPYRRTFYLKNDA